MITPESIERRMVQLSKEVDNAHADHVSAEHEYHYAKANFEISVARERLRLQGVTGLRVRDVEDKALLACENEYRRLHEAEALVKAARANAQRIRTQVDLARSVGTSVRASLEL